MKKSILTKKQVQKHTVEGFRIDGGHGKLVIKLRYDDECGNGHNSFSITGDLYRDGEHWSCGCLHDDIKEFAPEFAHLIKWHLMNSGEPMHYIDNTMYHARDTDTDGLKKGEYSACTLSVVTNDIADKPVKLFTTDTMYTNKQCNPNLDKANEKQELLLKEFTDSLTVGFEIVTNNLEWSKSKGKEPNLQAARNSAIWPDATLEQLLDKDLLKQRLPALREEFISVVESLGFTY